MEAGSMMSARQLEVRGIVLEPDGSPSPGAVLTLSTEGQRGMRMVAPVDEEGRCASPNDVPGYAKEEHMGGRCQSGSS